MEHVHGEVGHRVGDIGHHVAHFEHGKSKRTGSRVGGGVYGNIRRGLLHASACGKK